MGGRSREKKMSKIVKTLQEKLDLLHIRLHQPDLEPDQRILLRKEILSFLMKKRHMMFCPFRPVMKSQTKQTIIVIIK